MFALCDLAYRHFVKGTVAHTPQVVVFRQGAVEECMYPTIVSGIIVSLRERGFRSLRVLLVNLFDCTCGKVLCTSCETGVRTTNEPPLRTCHGDSGAVRAIAALQCLTRRRRAGPRHIWVYRFLCSVELFRRTAVGTIAYVSVTESCPDAK